MDYTTDREYQVAKSEISNALAALDRMGQENAVEYLGRRLSMLNDKQVALTPPGEYRRAGVEEDTQPMDSAQEQADAALIATFPSTGTCLTEGCPGSYDAWGKCHTCGDVD